MFLSGRDFWFLQPAKRTAPIETLTLRSNTFKWETFLSAFHKKCGNSCRGVPPWAPPPQSPQISESITTSMRGGPGVPPLQSVFHTVSEATVLMRTLRVHPCRLFVQSP